MGVSAAFTLYDLWVRGKYTMPQQGTPFTGCETARLVLDSMGVIHVSVTPVELPDVPENHLASEGLFLEKKVYEGRDILSLVHAARQAFLKGQLSDITFWVLLKKKMAFAVRFTVLLGWLLILLGIGFGSLGFFRDLGLGAFTVVMVLAVFDLPFELEMEERTSRIVKESGELAPHEMMCFRKVNRAVSFSGLTCLIRAPFGACSCFLKKG